MSVTSEMPTDLIGGAVDAAPSAEDTTAAVAVPAVGEGASKDVPAAGPAKVDPPVVAGAPEKYGEFKMPEGIEMPKELLGKAEPLFKELNLSQEQAQKTAEFLATEREAFVKSNWDSYIASVNELAEQSRADKEIGGEKLAESASQAKQFIQKFGRGEKGEEVFRVLETTGMGSHPAIISLFAKAFKAMAEDTPSKGEPATQARPSLESRLYPTMNPPK